MKHEPVRVLLDTVRSAGADVNERRNAIPDLALLLEKHSHRADEEKNYKELLRPNLLEIQLDEADKTEIVDALSRQLEQEPVEGGITRQLFWALKKADNHQATVAFRAVIGCISQKPLEDADVWQGILSLELLGYSVPKSELQVQLPLLQELRARVISSGGTDSRRAIESLFGNLRDRGLDVS
jgi:hypothetical protein